MKLIDCKIGDVITLFLQPDGCLLRQSSTVEVVDCNTIRMTLARFDPQDKTQPFMAVCNPSGYQLDENSFVGELTYVKDDISQLGLRESDYTHFVWLFSDVIIEGDGVGKMLGSAGMTCIGRYCHTFNEFAIANQSDGTFLCWSCRQRPTFMRTA